jgi:hypothetical protein
MSLSSNPSTQSRVGGTFVAYNYGLWSLPVNSMPSGTGSITFTVSNSTVNLGDDRLIMPFATNAPLRIGTETVTVSAVGAGCLLNSTMIGAGSITATVSNAHTVADALSSGTFGLQEALNDAGNSGGGVVVVDSAWQNLGGTSAMIIAATLPSNTQIQDLRTGTAVFVGSIAAGTATPLPGAVINATQSNVGGTTQINAQNTSADNAASSDVVCTADNGSNTTNYIDMGINSSTYNQAGYNSGAADDGYLYTQGGNLAIGTATAAKNVTIIAGGTTSANVVATFTSAKTLLMGEIDGVAATAGNIGQVIQSTVLVGAAVSIATSGTPINVTSIALTAGDWDVEGQVTMVAAAASMAAGSLQEAGINSTSITLPVDGSESYEPVQNAITTTSFKQTFNIARKIINSSSATTQYLVAVATFTAGTVSAYGNITARRVH